MVCLYIDEIKSSEVLMYVDIQIIVLPFLNEIHRSDQEKNENIERITKPSPEIKGPGPSIMVSHIVLFSWKNCATPVGHFS